MAATVTTGSLSQCPVVAGDRLSSLPDGTLRAIMSFLTARQAVQTCVLSRRWKDLWYSIPCLDIDQREFDAAASTVGRIAKEPGTGFRNSSTHC
ncbi:hypothetical protein PR202_ga20252 [Eleusine coracana subsp. coracana]|uniref:F-box domain-containing protein n=1 Tax=Eleusine coracana subsp. coracana TaxID=191504 RepID=A0AAV5CW99_ELECO|nr:hypothetical protein PR202_ga20252 [Eleusine coracana subsp. coracana]